MLTQSEISVDEGTFVFEIVPLCNSCWTGTVCQSCCLSLLCVGAN